MSQPTKLFLKNNQSPGDVVMMTAAVRDLHKAHPGKFLTNVKTSCHDIWNHNPNITVFKEEDADIVLDCNYSELISHSNQWAYHFIHGFHFFLEKELDIRIPCTNFRGDIYISDDEKRWMSQVSEMGEKRKFWLINAGGKLDFLSKWWPTENYQKVVDHFKDKILFVQIGKKEHIHPKLNGVIDLIGKTSLRQYVRLFYHSIGVLCPITCAMHLAAAVPSKHKLVNRPCVVVATGMESPGWEKYPTHKYLTRAGTMKCCAKGGCWKKYCAIPYNKEIEEDKICVNRIAAEIPEGFESSIREMYYPKCMIDISPNEVIEAIDQYYQGGILDYL